MQDKMVSIILPVYNAQRFLSLCLDSILRQSYKEWELIAVDDGSIDDSLEILETYAGKDHRIHVISKKNEGVSVARNVALEKVQGEYVYFVDADDVVMPEALAILVNAMETRDATCGKSDFWPIDEEGKQVFVNKKQVIRRRYDGKLMGAETFYHKILMKEYFLWTCLFRRDIIEKNQIRFIPHCRLMEDAAFMVDYLQYSDRNVYKDACVYGYRKYYGTVSDVDKSYKDDLMLILSHIKSETNFIAGNFVNAFMADIVKNVNSKYGNSIERKEYRILEYLNKARIFCLYKIYK